MIKIQGEIVAVSYTHLDVYKRQYIQSLLIAYGLLLLAVSVENKGVEPLTSCVQGRRSSQLS